MEVVDYQTKITLPTKNKVVMWTCIMYKTVVFSMYGKCYTVLFKRQLFAHVI